MANLGVSYGYEDDNLGAILSAQEDRRDADMRSADIVPNTSFEISTGFDPSDGANYAGGSSYTPGLQLIASSNGLAGVAGSPTKFRNVDVGAMSYEQAMQWSPSPLKERLGALRGLDGLQETLPEEISRMTPKQRLGTAIVFGVLSTMAFFSVRKALRGY